MGLIFHHNQTEVRAWSERLLRAGAGGRVCRGNGAVQANLSERLPSRLNVASGHSADTARAGRESSPWRQLRARFPAKG